MFNCSSKLNILVREPFYMKPNSSVSFQILVQHNTFNTKTIFNIILPFNDIKRDNLFMYLALHSDHYRN